MRARVPTFKELPPEKNPDQAARRRVTCRTEPSTRLPAAFVVRLRRAVRAKKNFEVVENEGFGPAVASLAADPHIMKKSGRVFSTWALSDEYGFTDADGSCPHWGRHFEEQYGQTINACDEGFYKYWFGGPIDTIFADWP